MGAQEPRSVVEINGGRRPRRRDVREDHAEFAVNRKLRAAAGTIHLECFNRVLRHAAILRHFGFGTAATARPSQALPQRPHSCLLKVRRGQPIREPGKESLTTLRRVASTGLGHNPYIESATVKILTFSLDAA